MYVKCRATCPLTNKILNYFEMVGRRERFQRRIISRWSDNQLPSAIFIIYAIWSCFFLPHGSARDNITSSSLLSDGQTLVSAGERFELGFFSPADSPEAEGIPRPRYVGIWYYKSNPRIFVWVANRGKPLFYKSGVLAIAEDGKLKLLDENRTQYWYTEVESSSSPHRVAKLMDSGNFVLQDDHNGVSLWESFKTPTDTFLAGMCKGENLSLTSWASQNDPKAGDFNFSMDQGESRYQIKKRYIPYWRSAGSKDVFNSDELPDPIISLLSNSSLNAKPTGKDAVYHNLTITSIDNSRKRLVMNYTGEIQYWTEDKVKGWSLIWREPRDNCSVFHYCGNFGICNSNHKRKCECLKGFEPSSPGSWSSEDFSGGCIRKTALCGGKDMFLKRQITKVGKTESCLPVASEAECSKKCRGFCSCTAYSYKESKRRDEADTCCIWIEELKDLREDFSNGAHELYIRVAATDLESAANKTEGGSTQQIEAFNGRKKQQWTLIFGMTIASGIILACILIYFYTRRKRINSQGRSINRPNMEVPLYESARHVKDMVDSDPFKEEEKQGIDIPFIDFESILAATDNFSEANKLGKGGFGPVYKAKFPGGQQIAVKRLSSASGQGLEEFKNEIVLIARLQHRNLVRLLGYCIEGHEKILLYEYMPNKSLDFFIFDPMLSALLHWEMRFNIIIGIARGLLYLHQDSRLRIIHRDLKTSNILLDQEMNPKISDFGLARIFKGKQTEGTTNRVVGTYGYMSPEYALDGFFSVKSDVFSFGVVVLEIISGKRNTGFYNSEQALSLLGYAWKLWQEGKALDMMDQKLHASSKPNEILNSINVGLLCVQEDLNDRPTMSDVVIMLGSEAMNLATPKRPAFVVRRVSSSSASSSNKPESNNELTNTLECR